MNIKNKGFTLIEILVVIGIVAILAAVVLLAINPARQFAQARNSQRASNVNALLNALGQNLADNRGLLTAACPSPLPATGARKNIGTDTAAGNIDLTACLTPTYLPAMLVDPEGTLADTEYTIEQDAVGRIKICAPESATETALPGNPEICVTR